MFIYVKLALFCPVAVPRHRFYIRTCTLNHVASPMGGSPFTVMENGHVVSFLSVVRDLLPDEGNNGSW